MSPLFLSSSCVSPPNQTEGQRKHAECKQRQGVGSLHTPENNELQKTEKYVNKMGLFILYLFTVISQESSLGKTDLASLNLPCNTTKTR